MTTNFKCSPDGNKPGATPENTTTRSECPSTVRAEAAFHAFFAPRAEAASHAFFAPRAEAAAHAFFGH